MFSPAVSLSDKITTLLLTASFLLGISIVCSLPPFENWDEFAHFSRLQSQEFAAPSAKPKDQQTAKERRGIYPVSMLVYDYFIRGPMPYGWIDTKSIHLEDTRGIKYYYYRDFFADPALQTAYKSAYVDSPLPRTYEGSPVENWEYQHPPLYYALAGPILKMLAGHFSLLQCLLALRLFSYLMGFAGFCIGTIATRRYLRLTGASDAGTFMILFSLYPFLLPEFNWTLARIGNDSLCLFLFGCIWAAMLQHVYNPRGKAWIYLAAFIAMGWFAKGLMIVISFGLGAFLLQYHFFVLRRQPDYRKNWYRPLAMMAMVLAPLGLLAIFVYLTSTLGGFGGKEFTDVASKHVFFERIREWYSLNQFIADLRYTYFTFVGLFGTISLVIIWLPFAVYKFYYAFIGSPLLFLSRREGGALFWLPFWAVGPLLLGIIVHYFVYVAFASNQNDILATPSHYLHIVSPALAFICAIGLKNAMRVQFLKPAILCIVGAVTGFGFFYIWSYMTMFSACAVPVHLNQLLLLKVPDILDCSQHPARVIEPLSLLAYPRLGLTCLFVAAPLIITAAILTFRMPAKTVANS